MGDNRTGAARSERTEATTEAAETADHADRFAAGLRAGPVQLIRTALAAVAVLWVAVAPAAELVHVGTLNWDVDRERFGGFSGLWISPDGGQLVAVTDKGFFAEADLTRNPTGALVAVDLTAFDRLLQRKAYNESHFKRDAEGLAISSDGRRYVSYEGHHRVMVSADFVTKPSLTHKWDFFWHLQGNSGLEALAIDAAGALYTVPERSGAWTRPFPVHVLRDGRWTQPFALPRSGRFLVVGADIGPDGRFYLLERDFRIPNRFSSRIRRFDLTDAGVANETTLLETAFGDFDNFEGISVWTRGDGETMVTLISDDNFSFLQSTVLADFRLQE